MTDVVRCSFTAAYPGRRLRTPFELLFGLGESPLFVQPHAENEPCIEIGGPADHRSLQTFNCRIGLTQFVIKLMHLKPKWSGLLFVRPLDRLVEQLAVIVVEGLQLIGRGQLVVARWKSSRVDDKSGSKQQQHLLDRNRRRRQQPDHGQPFLQATVKHRPPIADHAFDVAAQGGGAARRQQHHAVVGTDGDSLVQIGQPLRLALSFKKAEVGQVDVSFAQQCERSSPLCRCHKAALSKLRWTPIARSSH